MNYNIKEFKVTDSVYDSDISIFIGNGEAVEDHIQDNYKLEYPVDDFFSRGNKGVFARLFLTDQERKWYVIWMDDFKMTPFYLSVLSHEANHLTFEVMRDIDMILCPASEEAFTYYQDSIIYQFLDKNKNKCHINHSVPKRGKLS